MRERKSALDGLRGIAALAVYVSHIGLLTGIHVVQRGAVAVDLFFLLSGYVIGAAYEPRFAQGLQPTGYMWLRLKRLYPMIFVGAVIGAMSFPFRGLDINPWTALAAQLVFIPLATRAQSAFPLNDPQWSLWFELFINAVHALTWRLLTTRSLAVVAALAAAALVWIEYRYGTMDVGFFRENFLPGFVRVIASFSLGLLLYRLRDRLPPIRVPYPAVLAACVIAMAAPRIFPDFLVVLVLWPIVLIASLSANPRGIVRWFAETGGLISYPLYAIHLPALIVGGSFALMAPSRPLKAIAFAFVALGVPLLAWALALWLEPRHRERVRVAQAPGAT